jgi:NitT/TauT family transport system substrate-binding protein
LAYARLVFTNRQPFAKANAAGEEAIRSLGDTLLRLRNVAIFGGCNQVRMLKGFSVCLLALALAACGGSAAPPTSGSTAVNPAAPGKPGASTPASTSPAGSAAAAASAPASGQLRPMKLAVPTKGAAFAYLYVAQDLGFFRQRGIDPQIAVIPPANAVTALQSGDLDYATTVGSTIRAALRGLPVRVVMISSNHPDFMILGSKGITSLDQLKGKTIGVDAPQTTSNVMLRDLLKRKGFQTSDYKTLTATNDEARMALLQNGQVAGTVVEASTGVKFQNQYPVLAKISDFAEEPFAGLGAAQAGLKSKRDFLLAGLQATMQGVDAMRTQKDKVVPVLMKEFDLSAGDANQVYDALQPAWTANGRPTQAATDFELSNDKVALELKDNPTPDQVYDFSLLDELGVK